LTTYRHILCSQKTCRGETYEETTRLCIIHDVLVNIRFDGGFYRFTAIISMPEYAICGAAMAAKHAWQRLQARAWLHMNQNLADCSPGDQSALIIEGTETPGMDEH
jgi:hypothetical protein